MKKTTFMVLILMAFLSGCVNRHGVSMKYYSDCKEYYDLDGKYHKECGEDDIFTYKGVKETLIPPKKKDIEIKGQPLP